MTKNGTPRAVVMSVEEFKCWIETVEFVSKPKTVKALEQWLKEAKAGTFRSFKEVFGEDQ